MQYHVTFSETETSDLKVLDLCNPVLFYYDYYHLFIHFVILFIVTKVSLLGKVSVQTCLCQQVVFGLMLLVKR